MNVPDADEARLRKMPIAQILRGGEPAALADLECGDEPPRLSCAELSRRELKQECRVANQLVVRPMPLTVIEPVQETEYAGSEMDFARFGGDVNGNMAWGIKAVRANECDYVGKGVRVAVLDTGIDLSHPAFSNLVGDGRVSQKNFTSGTRAVAGDDHPDRHGTHCAGTIFGQSVDGFRIGIAPGVEKALIGKVLGNGATTESIVRGMEWALEQQADVISLSLTIDCASWIEREIKEAGKSIKDAVNQALPVYEDNVRILRTMIESLMARKGARPCLVVAATGNDSQRNLGPVFDGKPPSSSDHVLGVGAVKRISATSRDLELACFSNGAAEMVAPGVNIRSAGSDGQLRELHGTSMATPHVAGVAALWIQYLRETRGEYDLHELRHRLMSSCTDRNLVDKAFKDIGAGLVQSPTSDIVRRV